MSERIFRQIGTVEFNLTNQVGGVTNTLRVASRPKTRIDYVDSDASLDYVDLGIIAKDGVEVSLKLGGDSAKEGTTQAASPAGGILSSRRSPMLGTLGSRRRARQEREEADQREAAKREAEAKAREEERARREEEDKAQREAEREEQRRQLQQIQEELRKAREARQASEKEPKPEGASQSDTE